MVASRIVITECTVDEIRAHLRREPETLFAVLDACDEPRVPEKVRKLGDRAVSLYRGSAEEDYWAIAPYLAQVDEPLLAWILDNLWSDPWGLLVVAAADLAALRRHFRRFLLVRDPNKREMYFRFYDPRVLPVFLKTCAGQEVDEFFGPIRFFAVAGADQKVAMIGRVSAGA